jgi:hypothetical protein
MRTPAIKSKSLHALRLAAYQKILRAHQEVFAQKHLRTARVAHRWEPPPIPIGFQGIVVSKTERPYTYQVQDGNISRNIYFGPHASPRTGDEVRVRGILRQDGTVAANSVARLGYRRVWVEVPPTPRRAGRRATVTYGTTDPGRGAALLKGRLELGASVWSRNISIFAGGREIHVDVPHGIPVRIGGGPASVHDLGHGMPIRVYGRWDAGGRFHASRIDALMGP